MIRRLRVLLWSLVVLLKEPSVRLAGQPLPKLFLLCLHAVSVIDSDDDVLDFVVANDSRGVRRSVTFALPAV